MKPRGVTVSALLTKAVALVLEKHPIINAHYDAQVPRAASPARYTGTGPWLRARVLARRGCMGQRVTKSSATSGTSDEEQREVRVRGDGYQVGGGGGGARG
jgi:hypothetical protein